MLGFAPGFFNTGVTVAVLSRDGTEPKVREEWIMAVIRGSIEGREAITMEDGRGSGGQVVGLEVRMSFVRSDGEGSWKQERGAEMGDKGGRTTGCMRGQFLVNGGYFIVEECYNGVTVVSGVEMRWEGIRGVEEIVDH